MTVPIFKFLPETDEKLLVTKKDVDNALSIAEQGEHEYDIAKFHVSNMIPVGT